VKVRHRKGIANHSDPESCVGHREVYSEALTGETDRPAIEPRNEIIRSADAVRVGGRLYASERYREFWCNSARSETLSMSGSCLRRSWEVSSVPDGALSGGAGKGNRNPAIYAGEKSDTPILSKKLPNKDRPAEGVEKRGVAKGSVVEFPICRTQGRRTNVDGMQWRT